MPNVSHRTDGPLADAAGRLVRSGSADLDSAEACAPPGALLGIASRTGVRYAVAGDAQRIGGRECVPMGWDVRTDAGSVTKIVATSTALMSLVNAGEVDVDGPAARYLPELAGQGASVRELLEHRAGLREWWPLYLSGAQGHDAITLAAALPLRYEPGSGRHYSDLGFILLGELVARVAGAPLAEAVTELSLSQFGLTDTAYAAPIPGGPVAASSAGDSVEQGMIATGVPYPVTGAVGVFTRWRSHILVGEVNDGNAFHAFGGVAGHAGLFTTAADLLRFAHGALTSLAGDGPISASTMAAFTAAGADPAQALGFRRWRTAGGVAVGHTGFPGVAFALLPTQDAAVVMITNRLHASGRPRPTDAMWDDVLAAAQDELAEDREGTST